MEGNHINQIFWEEGKKSGKKTKISKNLISLAGKGELNIHRYIHNTQIQTHILVTKGLKP